MKRVILLMFLASLFFVGCEDKESEVDKSKVTITVSDTEVFEKKQVTITAEIDNVVNKPVTVQLSFGGSAEEGKQYLLKYKSITIPSNSKTGTLDISITDVKESPLFLDISIAEVTGAQIGSPSSQSITLKKKEVIVGENQKIKVNLNDERQLIRGFGGIAVPDWGNPLSEADGKLAFGTGDGQIGLSILRVRIAPNSNNFSRVLSIAKQAHESGLTIFASPWTPPASMKTNGNEVGGELKKESYADYAAHLKGFVDYMANNDVPIYAVSVQNEPDIEVDYESCFWDSEQMIDFISNHSKDIGDVKIIAPESFQFIKLLSNSILNNEKATANLDIVGGHIYGGGLTPYPLAKSKEKELWMTEHFTNEEDNRNRISYWDECMLTAREISDCMEADMNAYVWWYIKRFYSFIEDDAVKVTKKGYVMSHFARFIRPGFVRVGVENDANNKLNVTAYKKDDKVVVVVVNNNKSKINFDLDIEGLSVESFDAYVTDSAIDCINMRSVSAVDGKIEAFVDANSITTFVSK